MYMFLVIPVAGCWCCRGVGGGLHDGAVGSDIARGSTPDGDVGGRSVE